MNRLDYVSDKQRIELRDEIISLMQIKDFAELTGDRYRTLSTLMSGKVSMRYESYIYFKHVLKGVKNA